MRIKQSPESVVGVFYTRAYSRDFVGSIYVFYEEQAVSLLRPSWVWFTHEYIRSPFLFLRTRVVFSALGSVFL